MPKPFPNYRYSVSAWLFTPNMLVTFRDMLLHARMPNSACYYLYRANVQSQHIQHFMQVLNLYAKMMVWLEGADPTICVQTNTWTAAVLQLAVQFYKVLHCNQATMHTCMYAIDSFEVGGQAYLL